ncbi:MAG: TetR family transcriptional regulator [Microbacteriaceae bacterium]|nr:TetR family transcriptional regulator [Microbacteriaceae bacterium]
MIQNVNPARERLLESAARLLTERGPDVSTRAICDDAAVTPPTLYHHFGDRAGLLDAVVSHGFSAYLDRKRSLKPSGDPIEDVRRGWDDHIAWGVANPSFYVLMFGQVRQGVQPPAAAEAEALLQEKLEAIARAGRLRMPPQLAMRMFMSANVGLVLQLIRKPDAAADELSARLREAMIATVTVDVAADRGNPPAVTLSAALAADPGHTLEPAELAMMRLWLDRLSLAPAR